jgi:predicted nucleic acid-binding protein
LAEVISNTSPLQYLHQLDLLDRLHDLVGVIVVPVAVVAELQAGRNVGVPLPVVEDLSWVEVRTPKGAPVLPLVRDLGAGEASALALALETPGATVLLDDRLARRVASSLGIPIRGTVGLLLDFKHRSLIASVAPFLDELESLRFRLSARTRAAVLGAAGEISR